eukprot:2089403-Rhodomonas_salina.1
MPQLACSHPRRHIAARAVQVLTDRPVFICYSPRSTTLTPAVHQPCSTRSNHTRTLCHSVHATLTPAGVPELEALSRAARLGLPCSPRAVLSPLSRARSQQCTGEPHPESTTCIASSTMAMATLCPLQLSCPRQPAGRSSSRPPRAEQARWQSASDFLLSFGSLWKTWVVHRLARCTSL